MPLDPVLAPDLLGRVTGRRGAAESLRHVSQLAAREAESADWPAWSHPAVREALRGAGIESLWSHQRRVADLAHSGQHVVVATGTASGKSIGYLLPALSAILSARGPREERRSATLYIAPTKALAHDQSERVRDLDLVRVSTHDGDASPEQRLWTRDHAEYVLTNPDMLHHSLLPGHQRWARFFSALDFVVVDEVHHYRGVFGAHVAHILRRLRRVCASYGSSPTFVLASATVAEPSAACERLTGLEVAEVTEDGSPRGATTLALWEPPLREALGENGRPGRRTATAEVTDLLTDLVVDGVRTLAFVQSRRSTETVALATRRNLAKVDPSLEGRVAAYRGGYLPEERRDLEERLRSGELLGLAATQALELGIDISGLDAVLLAGFPGTRAAFWQQVGRAGRGVRPALGVLVARDDPLDSYLVNHPETLLGAPVEAFVFDPDNPYVLGPHLCAAAAELPLTEEGPAGIDLFGPTARGAVEALTSSGMLRRRPRGWFWTDRSRASDLADLRSTGGPAVHLIESATGRVVGLVDHGRAPGTVHEGAVYLHQGETWMVTSLDLDEGVATVENAQVEHSTSAREASDITIVHERQREHWPNATLAFGMVEVSSRVVSYLRRRQPGGEVIGEYPLDLPEQRLETQAVWWTIAPGVLAKAGIAEGDLPGAAHAAEHASIGLLPLFATCDRWDIGGVSTALHPDTGMLTVFVHDGRPGGAGFAERGFRAARAWLSATRETISSCECEAGCPSCVQSPKCGNQNEPLDKQAAVRLLDLLLS